jgi:hypothetical protein
MQPSTLKNRRQQKYARDQKSENMICFVGINTSFVIVRPVVRRPKEVLVFNIYEVLGRANGLDVCHLNAYINSNTFPPY